MFLKRKNKFKPLYKKFIKLRENPQNRKKVLKFKKEKWKSFIEIYERKLRWYKKYKARNQNRYIVSKYPNRFHAYTNRYKRTLQSYINFNLFYGNIGKKTIKSKILKIKTKKIKNKKPEFLKLFEKRLDVVLYRAKFCHSLRNAQQLISHEKVLVNNQIVKSKSFELTKGDLITVKLKYYAIIESNIRQTNLWPIPPKHLTINYKTLQIIFGDLNHTNLSLLHPFHLNLEKILGDFTYQ